MTVAICYVIVILDYPYGIFLAWLAFAIQALIVKNDVCPSCARSISMLPSEGHFRLPELSKAIRYCPYCGADFSWSEKSDKEPATAASKQGGPELHP